MNCHLTQRISILISLGENQMTAEHSRAVIPEAKRLDDLDGATAPVAWLWHGYLARESITLLTSLWKTGKTTLLSALLGRLRDGGLFAGRPLAAGRAAVVSEESLGMWQQRGQRLPLGSHVHFYCRPFRGSPTAEGWNTLIESIIRLHEKERLDLAVIDPLAAFLPVGWEGLAGNVLQALLPLQRLTEAGLSVLLLHHPRKGEPPLGQAARGSGALPGFADIVVEMKSLGRPESRDRRRRLVAFSRQEETPRDLVIELNAEGTDYIARGELADEEFTGIWPTLQDLLERVPGKLTREAILNQWPRPDNKPDGVYLWRVLERGLTQNILCRDGEGHKGKPFRYWLAGRKVVPGRMDDLPPLDDLFPERLLPIKR
jgi:hypothetical protein